MISDRAAASASVACFTTLASSSASAIRSVRSPVRSGSRAEELLPPAGRFEVYGDAGRMVHDMGTGSIRAFIDECIAKAKRMALASALSHSSYAPESCASFGDGMTALGGGGGGVAGALYGHCPQLGSCSRLGVGLVLYNGTLWAVAQGGE